MAKASRPSVRRKLSSIGQSDAKRRKYDDYQSSKEYIQNDRNSRGRGVPRGDGCRHWGNILIQSRLGVPNHLATVSANSMMVVIGAVLWLIAVVGDAAHGVLMFPVLKPH